MRHLTFHGVWPNRAKTIDHQPQEKWDRHLVSSALAFSGALLFVLAGLVTLIVYTFFDRNDAALNYGGVACLVVAYIFLSAGAHFLDRSDEDKRRCKKLKREKLGEQKM